MFAELKTQRKKKTREGTYPVNLPERGESSKM